MVNYQHGKVYKLVSFQNDKVYVGSTCESLSLRKAKHKHDFKRYLLGNYNYVSSFEIVKYDDADIILLENCPCETKEELHARERFHIEAINNCVNRHMPNRKRPESYKLYRQANIEAIKQHKNTKNDCSICSGKYTTSNKAHHYKSKKHIKALNP
jgi:hypothetical protein